jgi:hypothetical protein
MAALKIRWTWNRVIALGLALVNLFVWAQMLLALAQPHIVDPIMDPEVQGLLNYISSGKHSGETWQVNLTELEAEQTITWYLQKYPQIPFAYPQVKITPDYVTGEGDVLVTGLRLHVSAKVHIILNETGLPVVKIISLNLPLPPAMRQVIEDEIQVQLRRADLLPVRFTSAEWKNGEVVVKGVIK